jgi:hypothetical protein
LSGARDKAVERQMSKHKSDLEKLKAKKKSHLDTEASTEHCSCCVYPPPFDVLFFLIIFSGDEDAGG